MDAEGKARLAIRTVLVTTRAAVAAHLGAGRHELRLASVQRGLVLLRDLRDRVIREGASAEYEDAERELNAMADARPVPIPVQDADAAELPPPRTGRRSPAAPS